MNTDKTWEWYGEKDPYYGVLTDPEYSNVRLNADSKSRFFTTGELHITTLLKALELNGFLFSRNSACDFGCGVGRLLLPLAKKFHYVYGIDISEGMLRECKRNADENNIANIELIKSDSALSGITGKKFDLVHSFIVLQHIPHHHGLALIRKLLESVNPGGMACLHVQYAGLPLIQGIGLKTAVRNGWHNIKTSFSPVSQMLMNAYPLNQVFELLDQLGFAKCHVEFTKTTKGGIFIWAQRTQIFEYRDVF